MKKFIFSALAILSVIIVLESFAPLEILKKDGAAPGYTGSPGDSLKNCTACHGGVAVKVNGWVTSDIPSTGYVPGKTYTITATNSEADATRFGFEVSPQNLNGDLLGKLIVNDVVKTKLVGADKYITYTENGVESINSMSWSFDWVAPSSGSGEVVFYGAFNSNFDGHKQGDQTFLSTLKVPENLTTGIQSIDNHISDFKIYPNSTSDVVNVSYVLNTQSEVKVDLVDLTGRVVAAIINETQNGAVTRQFKTAGLPSGNYLVCIRVNGNIISQKLTVTH